MKGWQLTCFMLFILAILEPSACSRDDTDPMDGRSGMHLFTDSRTGCQYLSAGFGGLTPRMDRNGKQVCQ